jgi:hypothetical protein
VPYKIQLVAGAGFEPATFGLRARLASTADAPIEQSGGLCNPCSTVRCTLEPKLVPPAITGGTNAFLTLPLWASYSHFMSF